MNMKKIAYFDCFSGISGDMILGAMVDAGLPLAFLNRTIIDIIPKGVTLKAKSVKRHHLAATKVDVLLTTSPRQKLKDYPAIRSLIQNCGLSSYIKQKSSQIFEKLADCEGKVHGTVPNRVTFEELGGFDTVVDIVGAVAAIEFFGIDEVRASALNVGEGLIQMDHGTLPVPGPVTSHLLKNIPVYSNGVKRELTTPTGAAILSTLSVSFGSIPLFNPVKIGMGAGDYLINEFPNLLRLIIGNQDEPFLQDQVYQIETHIDDLNPQVYESLMENLFQAGALDVALIPIIMKKSRPAILLKVLSPLNTLNLLSEMILKETTSLGLRIEKITRRLLRRENERFHSSLGRINVKKSFVGNEVYITPEYEDCKIIAKKNNKPLRKVLKQIEAEIQLTLNKKSSN
jgi:pyridinium-3,5-bisthiocarboxylic acid mononucleotide nickel chelatase